MAVSTTPLWAQYRNRASDIKNPVANRIHGYARLYAQQSIDYNTYMSYLQQLYYQIGPAAYNQSVYDAYQISKRLIAMYSSYLSSPLTPGWANRRDVENARTKMQAEKRIMQAIQMATALSQN